MRTFTERVSALPAGGAPAAFNRSGSIRQLACAVLGAGWLSASIAQESLPPATVLARAGDVFITEREFLERYELLPGFGRHRKDRLEESKLKLLYSIIAEKLLAQHAGTSGLARGSVVARGLMEMKKLLVRDQLYRQEIIEKVTITSAETERGMARAVRQVDIAFIFFPNEADARFVRSRVRSPADLQHLGLDSSYGALRDTASVIWGEAESGIEDAAYTLGRSEVSSVISAGMGWYLLWVTNTRRNEFYSGMAPDVLRERVETTLRRRKERTRLDAFVPEALNGRTGHARNPAFRTLTAALQSVCLRERSDSMLFLTPNVVRELRLTVGRSLAETLAVAETTMWTIDDVVTHLATQAVGFPTRSVEAISGRLNTALQIMVQQELLGQEGLRRGLDSIPAVRRKVDMWSQYFLAGALRDSLEKVITVSDGDAWNYLKWKDTSVAVPLVRIRELRTSSAAAMQSALESLEKGATLEEVVHLWSVDSLGAARGGVSPYFRVTDRPPLGALAASMEPGERYGPVADGGALAFFELLEKTYGSAGRDSLHSDALGKARNEARALKKHRALTLMLARLAQQLGVEVYRERLKAIVVSPVPMMTFRLLGFGGRMLEVPFVHPEIEWLTVDPASGESLP